MNLALLPNLRCPACGGTPLTGHAFESSEDGLCRDGVVVCDSCGAWYPISEFLLELLPERHAAASDREGFRREHGTELAELGVGTSSESRPEADLGLEGQAGQRQHFDELAERTDEFSYKAFDQLPFWRAHDEMRLRAWRPLVRPGSLLLDICCADGRTVFRLAGPEDRVLGFDISPNLIRQAIERARELGRQEEMTFFVADADRIPVIDEAVDLALCYGVLHHLPHPDRTLREAARTLRPGGVYLGLENNKSPLRPLFDWLMRRNPQWYEEAGTEPLIGEADLRRWAAGTQLELKVQPTAYVPPHLANRLGFSMARLLLRWTDAVMGRIPGVRRWGGLVAIVGRKD